MSVCPRILLPWIAPSNGRKPRITRSGKAGGRTSTRTNAPSVGRVGFCSAVTAARRPSTHSARVPATRLWTTCLMAHGSALRANFDGSGYSRSKNRRRAATEIPPAVRPQRAWNWEARTRCRARRGFSSTVATVATARATPWRLACRSRPRCRCGRSPRRRRDRWHPHSSRPPLLLVAALTTASGPMC